MSMLVTIAAMCMDHHNVATLQALTPDLAEKIIQALDTASHQRT